MIVIAAAGLSNRFRVAGYATPKFMLPLGNHTVFDEVLDSFRTYHTSEPFVVATRAVDGIPDFINARLKAHKIRHFHVAVLPKTQGMMPSVCRAVSNAPFDLTQPLTISVADIFRPNFEIPNTTPNLAIVDFGVRRGKATPVREKFNAVVHSCNGLGCYTIARAQDCVDALMKSRSPRIHDLFGEKAMEISEALWTVSELRARGYQFQPRIVGTDDYVMCGVPAQYEQLALARQNAPHRANPMDYGINL